MGLSFRQLLFLAATSTAICAGAKAAEGLDFFEQKIRPVLVSECVECHGSKKQKGGLRVDFRGGMRTGGENGPAVVPGDPGKSLLLAAIKHTTEGDLAMPKKRPKLSDAVIADFERWIAQNAPDPRTEPPREDAAVPWAQLFSDRKQWWCFQPVRAVEAPPSSVGDWSQHPVDRFLLAKMAPIGLSPSRDADRLTLIRRLAFVLTGLPPTPQEVETFAKSSSTEDAVDRLLASPQFGEQWARHWMDLVRYAETHGSEGDPEIPYAWRYRDYLISAFNEDVRCDQLIREHIAGDLLPEPRWNHREHVNQSVIGTTHLRLVEHGFQPVDTLDEQVKTVDSQIDVAMKAFQGLTVTCARCHDHKFDAISQRDYYALYGVFASCRPAAVTIDDSAFLEKHSKELTDFKARLRAALAAAWLTESERIPERIEAANTATVEGGGHWRKALSEAEKDLSSPLRPLVRADSPVSPESEESFHIKWDLSKESDYAGWLRHGSGLPKAPIQPGDFAVAPMGERVLLTLLPRGVHTHSLSSKHSGVLQSPRFRVDSDFISVRAAGGGGAQVRLIVDNYPLGEGGIFPRAALDRDQPQWVKLNVKYRRGSLAYLEFATRKDLTRVYKQAPEGAPSWFAVEKVAFHDANKTPGEIAPDAGTTPAEISEKLAGAIRAWKEGTLDHAGLALLNYFVVRELLPTRVDALPDISELVADYRKLEAEVPEPRRIAGVLEGEAFDAPLLVRGDHLKPADIVPRAYLSAINDARLFTDSDQISARSSGRLNLAHAISDPHNPLTSRVMVNRVWHWVFGRGLVATPDNFGKMGAEPTHPELLDFLAAKFSAPEADGGFGWSFQKLIRYLVTTRAFALSSEPLVGAREKDAGNAFLSHARVRRLEAESIRDTLLRVAGRLAPGTSGPSDNSLDPPDKQRRRSIYLSVRRTALNPFLGTFDAPKPFSTLGRRDETNVPAQSLTLLNDPLVHFCGDQWAERLLQHGHGTPVERVRAMFLGGLSRPPTDAESESALRYLEDIRVNDPARESDSMRDRASWRDLGIALFNTKEFIYLR